MEIFYEQEKNSIDVIFYGSSHVYSDINPAVLWREAGVASFQSADPACSPESPRTSPVTGACRRYWS